MSDTIVSITQNDKTYQVQTGLFINNQFVPSVSGKKFDTINPATGKVICSVYEGLNLYSFLFFGGFGSEVMSIFCSISHKDSRCR